jgi:hypothetical protein
MLFIDRTVSYLHTEDVPGVRLEKNYSAFEYYLGMED